MIEVSITANLDKLKAEAYQQAEEDFIQRITEDTVEECKLEAPVITGRLRDGHYSEVDGLIGYVKNDVEYALYVIYGTDKQPPNNYPQRALYNIQGQYMEKFIECLRNNGVDVG